jgi:hypothetical protein
MPLEHNDRDYSETGEGQILDPNFNPFGQLLTLLSDAELRRFRTRASSHGLAGLAQVLSDELADRSFPNSYPPPPR